MAKPTETEIEDQLRASAKRVFDEGNLDQLTVRRIRQLAEEALGLESNFFRGDPVWKPRSKEIIETHSQDLLNGLDDEEEAAESIEPPMPVQPARVFKSTTMRKRLGKGKPVVNSGQNRTKQSSQTPSIASAEPPQKKQRRARQLADDEQSAASEDQLEPLAERTDDVEKEQSNTSPVDVPALASCESEASIAREKKPMSNGKRRRDETDNNSSSKEESHQVQAKPSRPKKMAGARKPKKVTDLSAQDAKIKQLQGQLVKCGVRKLWHKELAPYDNAKGKIGHLEDMLLEVGIHGRFSEAQAKKIKARRELQADILEIQAGAEKWGKHDDEDTETKRSSRPTRTLTRIPPSAKIEDDESVDEDSD